MYISICLHVHIHIYIYTAIYMICRCTFFIYRHVVVEASTVGLIASSKAGLGGASFGGRPDEGLVPAHGLEDPL